MSLALTDAFDLVQAQFNERGRQVCMHFGWREKERHNLHEPRIVWVPGDDGTNIGDAGSNLTIQTWPLTYGVLWQRCSLYISAPADPLDPENERKQWTNTMTLRNALHVALMLKVKQPNFRLESERYETQIGRRAQVVVVTVISVRDDIQDDLDVGIGLIQVPETPDGEHVHGHVEIHELDTVEEFQVP